MYIIIFLIVFSFISYGIYMMMEYTEEDVLQERLLKISNKTNLLEEKRKRKAVINQLINEISAPLANIVSKKSINLKPFKQMLLEAGLPSSDEDAYKLMAKKIIFIVIGVVVAIFIVIIGKVDILYKLITFIVCPLTFYRLPDIKIKAIIKKKNDEIQYNLPDALDLLTVCVEAGLGLDAALGRVSQEITRTAPLLARELGRVSKDILSGVSRQEAFRSLAIRNSVQDVKAFTSLLIQTDKLGTSIANSLRVYSDTVRTRRRQRAETLAAQAGIKMTIPLVLFVLPSMFVILLAPAAITLIQNFKGMNH